MDCPSVTCYPTPGKARALAICEAFAAGAGGRVCADLSLGLQPGAAFFYGVTEDTYPLWRAAKEDGRDWYYGDNSYFDRGRQAHFRVTKNAFQVSGMCDPKYSRLDAIGARIKPWRVGGAHVVVCEQSKSFLRLSGAGSDWLDKVLAELRAHTERPIRTRRWDRDKAKMSAGLQSDLAGAWALVTHSSAAANEALLSGVPVFVTGHCAALPMSSGVLAGIEAPARPDNREEWAAGVAANQWALDEIKSGQCWRDLNA